MIRWEKKTVALQCTVALSRKAMKRTFLTSLLPLVMLLSVVVWSVERSSRTQEKGNGEAAQHTINGQWTVVSAGVGDSVRDFQFLDENHGWAITAHSVWKTTDGGQTWAEIRKAPTVKLLEHYEPQETMEEVQFLSQTEGWVVEGTYLIHTTDGGASWERTKPDNVTIRSVRFLDRDNGWFVGQLLRLPSRKGEVETWHPVIYGTKDRGENWRRLYMGPEEHYPLWDVWPLSSKDIWAVGFSILHSDDGGATWKKVRINNWEGARGMPGQVRFSDSGIGWITVNEPGGYLFTNDAGQRWESRPVSIVPGGFADVVYVSPTEAWGVAGDIYQSSDSGSTWVRVLEGDYFRIQYLKDKNLLFASGKHLAKCKIPLR